MIAKANERIEDGVPQKEQAVQAAQRRVEKLHADQERLTEHLLSVKPSDVPAAFWRKAKDLEREVEQAKAEVARLTVELNEMKASRLKAADYRKALRRFTEVYAQLDAVQKGDLLAYLLDRVEVRPVMQDGKATGTEVTIALLGEPPDVARYEDCKPLVGPYQQPPKWLPIGDARSSLSQGESRGSVGWGWATGERETAARQLGAACR